MNRSLLFAALVLPAVASAVPLELSHQGRLLDANGDALTGDHQVDVSLFDVATDGTALWSDTFATVTFDEGYFTVVLGSGAALEAADLASDDVWVELNVDSGTPLPRLKLASVPFAIRAGTATNVSGGVVNASEIQVDGNVVINSDGTIATSALPSSTDTLAGLSCNDNEIAVYSAGAWACGPAVADHDHVADDIVDGTIAAARLPVGGGADQVAAGNHTHTDLAASNHGHTDLAAASHGHTDLAGAAHTHDSATVTLTAADVGALEAPACTGGDAQLEFGGHCYVHVPGAGNFAAAQAACDALGMHLVTITSDAENDAIVNAFTHAGDYIGHTDAMIEGEWMTVTGEIRVTGEDGVYTNWGGAEPNNSGGEDCAHFRADGLWNDIDCSATQDAICERDF